MRTFTPALLTALLGAARLGSLRFTTELCRKLCENLELRAATYYLATKARNNLILRGAHGFEYTDYKSFVLPMTSLAGRSFISGKVICETNLTSKNGFRDVILVSKHNLTCAVVVPIFEEGATVGTVCLYPGTGTCDQPEEFGQSLSELLSSIYEFAKERTKTNVRARFVEAIGRSTDLNSMMHRLCQTLVIELGVEAASIYTYERNSRFLRLRATTGLAETVRHQKSEIHFSPTDTTSPTYKVFLSGEPIERANVDSEEKYPEKIGSNLVNRLYFPIRRIGARSRAHGERRCEGVLRVANRQLEALESANTVPFSIEDYDLLDYVGEMIAVLLHLFSGRESQFHFFEKIMHGTKSNLITSIQNLDILETRGNIAANVPAQLHYAIHDTKEWLLDIINQIGRLESPSRYTYSNSTIRLGGDVLAPLVSYFKRSAESRGFKNYSITHPDFLQLPEVFGDQAALVTVFRNLTENALKYVRQGSRDCRVEIESRTVGDTLQIRFRDFGMGIEESDREAIFDEGFRSDAAVAQDPSGTGLGLTQSREIITKLGGDIVLESTIPTTFVVTIRAKRK